MPTAMPAAMPTAMRAPNAEQKRTEEMRALRAEPPLTSQGHLTFRNAHEDNPEE